jgi:probable phosphoglycerate mutase
VAEKRGAAEQRPFALPSGATEIILVRHGASEAALPGTPFPLVDGRADPNLSDAGHEQAAALADRLSGEGIARLFVTPLRRTHQTAAPLARATGLRPAVVDEFVEVHLGEWEGGELRVRVAQGDPLVRDIFEQERWDVIPGAESLDSLGRRVRAGVERVVAETGPDAVAVAIAHGGVLGEICRQATASRPFAFVHMDNGSVSRLVVHANGRWMLRSFNETSHLAVRTGPSG